MFTFLRKLRISLFESGSSGKYIIYAIGEITLVVIGILIALQINNWNQDRIERNTEIEILKGLQNTLEADLIDLNRHMRFNDLARQSMKIVLRHLEQDLPYHDSLSVHFALTTMIYWTPLNSSVFETLKSQGIELISNTNLRDTIALAYGTFNIDSENQGIRYHAHMVNARDNLLNTRFKDFWNVDLDTFSNSQMVPVDYESLKTDQEYLYFIKTLPNLQYYYITVSENKTREYITRMLTLINNDLGKEVDTGSMNEWN